jgi:hypothetical protein
VVSSSEPPLFDYQWNELDPFPAILRDLIVSIVGIGKKGKLLPIGTGFVIQARGDRAIVLSAAHNIHDAIREIQYPYRLSNPTTPKEFLAPEEISAASNALRVLVERRDRFDLCRVAQVAWDANSDLAFLTIVPQDDGDSELFEGRLKIGPADPLQGDVVGVLGFADHSPYTNSTAEPDGVLTRRPVFRVGRVTHVGPEGIGWHKSPCVESTIPVFDGMSGGAAFTHRDGEELLVFGVIAGDVGDSSERGKVDPMKMDRSVAGRSYLRLLPREITPSPDGSQIVSLRFTVSGTAVNPEIPVEKFAGDLSWDYGDSA